MGKLQDCKYKYEIGKRKGKERERERKRRRQRGRGRGRGKEEIGKRNRNRKGKGKEKETKRRRFNVDYNPEHPVSRVIVDNGLLVCQILSRLPVKSLMRFKCVSKGWKSMIEDPNFINLHLTHSQERPGLFIFLPKSSAREEDQTRDYESFMSADLSFKDKAANIHTLRKTEPFSYSEILGPITGLVCFVDHCAVRIYNVGTGEATPWIKSRVSIHVKEQNGTVCRFEEPRCYFGFDSTTKKHKALFVWREGVFKDFPVCEVLTVGDNTWRIIDEVQPYIPSGTLYIYANGSIYWYLSSHDDIKPRFEYSDGDEVIDYSNEFIMAFDFGSEKFRVIPIPKFTISNLEYGDIRFLEVDGCLAILRWRGAIVKMWIFHDHNKANGISGGRRDNWTQVSITLPTYLLRRMFFFHSVAGKDHAILETYRDDPCQKYSMYDRNVKLAEFFLTIGKNIQFRSSESMGFLSFRKNCHWHLKLYVQPLQRIFCVFNRDVTETELSSWL